MINPKYRGICSQRLAKIRLESGEFERLVMGKGQKKEKPHFTRLEGVPSLRVRRLALFRW